MLDLHDGDIAVVTITYLGQTDPVTGNRSAQDPTQAFLDYEVESATTEHESTVTTLTYSGATTPQAGVYAREGVGEYVAWLDTTDLPGTWTVQARAAGTGQATSSPLRFTVEPALV